MNIVNVGAFIKPAGAKVRVIRNEQTGIEIWKDVKTRLASLKPDGWRIQAHKSGDVVKLFSRKGLDYTGIFPKVAQAVNTAVKDEAAILDMEIVGYDPSGKHIEANKIRMYAAKSQVRFRCFLLDALFLSGNPIVDLPFLQRVKLLREVIVASQEFDCIEFTYMESEIQWVKYWQDALSKFSVGYDGVIIRKSDSKYFDNIIKVKTEETLDLVVIGLLENSKFKGLLLAAPDNERRKWVPITRVHKKNVDWNTVWEICKPFLVETRPPEIDEPIEHPTKWIIPRCVVKVTLTEWRPSSDYLIRPDMIKRCTYREDKDITDATSLSDVFELMGDEGLVALQKYKTQTTQRSLF